jgi:hypothetical protein
MTDAEGVQQELQDYLHKKGINTLFINLVESLLLAKPENPILHIIQYLQTNYPEEATPRRKPGAKEDNPAASPHVQCTPVVAPLLRPRGELTESFSFVAFAAMCRPLGRE